MFVQEKAKKPRNTALLLDIIHIVLGGVIVVLAVLSFLSPEDHMVLFPLIFLLAAVLNLINGIYRIYRNHHEKKKKLGGLPAFFFGIALLALSVVSAVSIWL